MSKKTKKEEYVTFCPYCHSKNVGTDMSNPALVHSGIFAKVCFDCGYTANFFPQIQKNKKLPKRKKATKLKKEVVKTVYKTDKLRWVWRITAPIGIIISLLLIIFSKEKIFFQLGLILFLPWSIIYLIIMYRNDLVQKYVILKILYVALLFYILIMWAFYFLPRIF